MFAIMEDLIKEAHEKGVYPERFLIGSVSMQNLLKDARNWNTVVDDSKPQVRARPAGLLGEFSGVPVFRVDGDNTLELECRVVLGYGKYSRGVGEKLEREVVIVEEKK